MKEIDLRRMTAPVIDLEGVKAVSLTGHWKGARIILKNASNTLMQLDAVIESTHAEDALCFDGDVSNLEIIGFEHKIKGGGITFWGRIENVTISSVDIFHPHTGIRATQPLPHKNVTICKCYIIGASHEGIYLGPSFASTQPGSNFQIFSNRIIGCGWDAIQVGNVKKAQIHSNTIWYAGTTSEYGQDYAITVNPNSIAYVWDNQIHKTAKHTQCLDSRMFDHAPK